MMTLENHFERSGSMSDSSDQLVTTKEAFCAPEMSRYSKIADRWILPGLIDFTRFGYWRNKNRWKKITGNQSNKHILITGARTGLGLCAAKELAKLGAELTLVVRKAEDITPLVDKLKTVSGNKNVTAEVADLSLIGDVKSLTDRLVRKNKKIDVLINNAGALINPRLETKENLEQSFALLLLSPYRLTLGLKPLLNQSEQPRIINVVSGGMYTQKLCVNELIMPKEKYSGSVAYARAKRGLMIVTESWADAWKEDGFVVNAMHPGWADTPGVQNSLPTFRKITKQFLRTPEQGADTIVWLAAASEAGLISGKLFLDREPRTTYLIKSTVETKKERLLLLDFLDKF